MPKIGLIEMGEPLIEMGVIVGSADLDDSGEDGVPAPGFHP